MKQPQVVSPEKGPYAIPLCVPDIHGHEWAFLKDCLDTNWVSSVGPYVTRLEESVSKYVGTRHAVATINGTAALHIALLVAGIEPNDEVLVSTLSFIAPANAIRYVQAWPVFIDAEPDHWQMDVHRVAEFLREECRWHEGALYNKKTQRRVKAILPVHILGHPVDLNPILALASHYGLTVIEDAAESLGAEYRGVRVGQSGDIACFSFNGNKIITAGSGGMIVTDNEEWASRAKFLTTQAKDGVLEPVHDEIGYNYRLSNLHAALGCAQLERLDHYVDAKRTIGKWYSEALRHINGITLMREASWAFSTFWMYTVLINEKEFGMTSRTVRSKLREAGIEARSLWQPNHLSGAHRQNIDNRFDVSEGLYASALSLPCSVGMDHEHLQYVVEVIASLR